MKKILYRKKNKVQKGFTLLEMLVSITLFSFVVTIALGALFTILKANEKTKVIKTVVNNLNMALEGMSREIRVGYDYDVNCSSGAGGCTKFEFKTRDGCDAFYEFSNDTVYKKIKKKEDGDPMGVCSGGDIDKVSIVGEDVIIDTDMSDGGESKFYTAGVGSGDNIQPRLLIVLSGYVRNYNLENDEKFDIQTTVSQRKIEP